MVAAVVVAVVGLAVADLSRGTQIQMPMLQSSSSQAVPFQHGETDGVGEQEVTFQQWVSLQKVPLMMSGAGVVTANFRLQRVVVQRFSVTKNLALSHRCLYRRGEKEKGRREREDGRGEKARVVRQGEEREERKRRKEMEGKKRGGKKKRGKKREKRERKKEKGRKER